MKNWKPIFVENSRIPVILSYIAPITIGAITCGFIVFSRDKMDEELKRHETIHFQQFLETLFIGFILFYLMDFLWNLILYRDGKIAYYKIRAEQEAYNNDHDPLYLQNRKRWKWLFPEEGEL